MVKRLLEKPGVDIIDIDKLLSKGALVHEDMKPVEEKKNSYLNLRIPTNMLAQVDEALKDRVGITRTGWILEAIHEKLKSLQ